MRLIIVLIALFAISKSVQKVEHHGENSTPSSEMLCIKIAFEIYLENYRNIRVLLTNSSNTAVDNFYDVPLFVITQWDFLKEEIFPEAHAGAVIIFLEGNFERDFSGLKSLKEITKVNPVLVVCVTKMICGSRKYVKQIIEIAANTEFRYVAINELGIISIYEYTTTIKGSCGIGRLFKFGNCSDKSTAKKALEISVNFNQCPVQIVTWFSPPYSEPCGRDDWLNHLCGIAGSAVHIIVKKVNATHVVNSVKTADDLRELVANNTADLGFGALDDRPYKGVVYSTAYMFVQATIVAPHSIWALEHSSGNILQPFENEVWIGIGVVMLFIFLLGRVVPYFRTIYADQLFGIFLGIPVSRQPKRIPSRIYFLSFVLFGYICSQAYLTNLTRVLTTPRQETIKTLNDIENSKIRVSGPAAGRNRFEGYYPRIYKDFQIDDQSVYYVNLRQLLQGRFNAAYYVEDLDRNIASWKNVEAINERFNWYSVVLAAPNSSTFLKTSNQILMKIWESGILGVHKTFVSPLVGPPKFEETATSGSNIVLKFGDLKGVFFLLIGGLTSSILVFVIETAIVYAKREPELKVDSEISPELTKQKQGHGTMLPRQTYRCRRY